MSADQTLRGWLDGLRRRWQALTRLRVSARQAAAVALIAGAAWAVDAATSPTGLALSACSCLAIVAAVGRGDRPPGAAAPAAEQSSARASRRGAERRARRRRRDGDGAPVRPTRRRRSTGCWSAPPRPGSARSNRSVSSRGTRCAGRCGGRPRPPSCWPSRWRSPGRRRGARCRRRASTSPRRSSRWWSRRGTRASPAARRCASPRGIDGLPDGATPDVPALIVAAAGAVPQPMRRAGAGYVVDWPHVEADFRYRVVAGALTSPDIPGVRDRRGPRHAHRSRVRVPGVHRDGAAPRRGRRRHLRPGRHHRDDPRPHRQAGAARRRCARGGTALPLKADGQEATTLVAGLTIAQDSAYRVGLEDIDGLASPEGTRVLRPRARRSAARRPHHAAGGRRQVTKLEEVWSRREADDDYGVDSLELVYAVKGGGEKVVPFRPPRTPRPASTARTRSSSRSSTSQPGDFVTYYARARDISRGKARPRRAATSSSSR